MPWSLQTPGNGLCKIWSQSLQSLIIFQTDRDQALGVAMQIPVPVFSPSTSALLLHLAEGERGALLWGTKAFHVQLTCPAMGSSPPPGKPSHLATVPGLRKRVPPLPSHRDAIGVQEPPSSPFRIAAPREGLFLFLIKRESQCVFLCAWLLSSTAMSARFAPFRGMQLRFVLVRDC